MNETLHPLIGQVCKVMVYSHGSVGNSPFYRVLDLRAVQTEGEMILAHPLIMAHLQPLGRYGEPDGEARWVSTQNVSGFIPLKEIPPPTAEELASDARMREIDQNVARRLSEKPQTPPNIWRRIFGFMRSATSLP